MRGTLLLVSMTLALLLASGVALAEYGGGGGIEYNTVRCDGGKCEGTTNDDRMVGTDRRDILYAFKGSDLLFGNGGSDDLYGFLGYDQLRAEMAATSSGAERIEMTSTAIVARTF
jgi:Ca2+-binding RTX toxin-like protein